MLLLMVWHQHVYTQPRQDSNDCTSLILAIGDDNDATAEALIAPTASAGALDVQVRGRGQGGRKSGCMWVVWWRWEGQEGDASRVMEERSERGRRRC